MDFRGTSPDRAAQTRRVAIVPALQHALGSLRLTTKTGKARHRQTAVCRVSLFMKDNNDNTMISPCTCRQPCDITSSSANLPPESQGKEAPPSSETGAAVVLGTFDGVHRGHQALLAQAHATGMPIVVYTFSASPKGAPAIVSREDRERLLTQAGAKVIFDDFAQIRGLSPAQFVRDILVQRLHAAHVVCGFNYRFGVGASGDSDTLRSLLAAYHVPLDTVSAVLADGAPISSTRIRQLLADGKPEEAEKLLGRPFFYRLPVLHGKELGRTIGFPTVNQRIPPSLVSLRGGVYATQITFDGICFPSVTNIGSRPTVNAIATDITCESHIIGFTGDLYGKLLTVEFLSYLRPEKKFTDLTELRTQIDADRASALRIFSARQQHALGIAQP